MSKNKNETNERELTSKLSEWFNEHIQRNKFPFKESTNEAPARYDSKTYFGDIVLWINRESRQAYSYIEIKPPFSAKENLETLRKKALSYKVKYCFTWDFQNFNAYELKGSKLIPHTSEPTSVMNNISDWLRGDVQAVIKKYIYSFCEEIINLNETGKFRKFIPDKVYFVNYIRDTVNKLVPLFENHYTDLSKDKTNRSKFIAYGKTQGIAYSNPVDYYRLISRQSVYNLITKIIFYLTVRRYFDELPDLYSNDIHDLEKYLKIAFAKAQEKDWQAVFEESEIELFGIPKSSYTTLKEFFIEMKVYHFGELPEDVIGELFEEIIEPDKRHSLGQYFTNENLVDLILGFVVDSDKYYYADTTCGSGTFLIRIYDRLKYLSKKITHNQLLDKIWGFDIAKFPAELATINLFRQDISNFENFPRVRRTDIFKVYKGDEYDFPPPSLNKAFKKIKIQLPEFNAIVGNFPFIDQRLIEKEIKGYKNYLTKVLAFDYFFSYPKLFTTENITVTTKDHLSKLPTEQRNIELSRYVEKGFIQLKLSGQADIYAYIFIHTASLLSEKGQFAVITSNSWLDVSYGSVLKEFFLDNFKVKIIIGSWVEPWFDDAAVNTVVTILEKESDKHERHKNVTKFVKLKKKFKELIPYQDLKLESIKRWQTIDRLVSLIETADDDSRKTDISENIASLELDEMRIRSIKQTNLEDEIKEKGELAKWGKYLRAPDVYFELLTKCKKNIVPFKVIASIKRGYTTGINDFFYLEKIEGKVKIKDCLFCKNGRGWEGFIESKYLSPIIKSPKEIENYLINLNELKQLVFFCNESKTELKKNGSKFALKYIEWGEKQNTEDNIPFPKAPSVINRQNWYELNENDIEKAGIFVAKGINNRYYFAVSNEKLIVNNRLYNIYPFDPKRKENISTLLNSTIEFLFFELESRVNLGDGLIDNGKDSIEELPFINLISFKSRNIFNKLSKRKVLSIFEEIKQKDRIELDTKILEELGLDSKIYLPKIYDGLCELVKERLELPKMRKKKQKEKSSNAYDKVKVDVIEDCLPDGIRQFPEDFYTKGNYDSLKFESHSTNGKRLFIDAFFNSFQMKTEEGETIIQLDSEAKAEFAEILSRQSTFQIKMPAEEKIVEQILKNYRNYISKLNDQLTNNAKEKLHEWALAEKMAKEILEDYGLNSHNK